MTPDLPLFPTLPPNITGYPHKYFAMLLVFPLLCQGSGSCLCFKFYFHHPHPLKTITILQGPTQMTINSMQAFSICVGCAFFFLRLPNGIPLYFSYSTKCTRSYIGATHACHITSVTSLNGARYN